MQAKIFFEEEEVRVDNPYAKVLQKHVPAAALNLASEFLHTYQIDFKVAKTRNSKYGDFRASYNGKPPLITVNHELNPYAFLITLVHEMAHYTCWKRHGNRVKPHGEEWKKEFRDLMAPYLQKNIFPPDLAGAVFNYMSSPYASSCTDDNLMRAIKKYDLKKSYIFVEDLPAGSLFVLGKGRVFKKGEKIRKRFKCMDVKSRRTYLVHPLAEVILLEQ